MIQHCRFILNRIKNISHLIFVKHFFIFYCLCLFLFQDRIFAQARSVITPNEIKNDITNYLRVHSQKVGEVEIAHVSFLTPLRHKRDLQTREFHIIRIERKSPNTNLEIHLTNKTVTFHDFKAIVLDGDDASEVFYNEFERTEGSCIFEGHVLADGDEVGKAALSTCGHAAGFTGMVFSKEEHFIIEPQMFETELGSENSQSIPHVITKTGALPMKELGTDEMHVPYDKLVEAAALEKEEESKHHSKQFEPEVLFSTADDSQLISLTPLSPDNEETEISSEEIMSLRSRNSYGSQSSSSKNKDRDRNKSKTAKNNVKRQANESTGKAIVEIAVFTDPDFYNQMKIRYPKDTLKKIKDYIMTMVNAMDMLYEQKSLETDLVFKLVHLEIQKKWPTKLNKHGGKAKSFLTSFCDYAGDLNENNELWDHALMLTGADLREEGTSSTAGLAWAGTMCFRYYSCSISEGTQFGSVYMWLSLRKDSETKMNQHVPFLKESHIITHEIGHSMGMEHDGDGVSSKCDKEKYLMSPTTGPGKVTWSSCSGKNLQDFLKYGTSELRGSRSATKPTCLTESVRPTKAIEYSNGELPGVKYNPTKQCALALGRKFAPVNRKDSPFNNICWMLYCGNQTHAVSTHPALEGSDCGKGKHCRGGNCINKT